MSKRKQASRGDADIEFDSCQVSNEIDSIESLIERRKQAFKRIQKFEDNKAIFNIKVKLDGPIGVLHFGDPHLDADGSDWYSLERDIKLVQDTKGLFATNIGDTTNNWVGRLGHLYGEQTSSAEEAWRLAEYFINSIGKNWLYIIGGNHDLWSGQGDPLKWIAKQNNAIYENYGIRVRLNFNNDSNITINARHQFPGNSIWNPNHGTMREAQVGHKDDIIIAGHKHISGYAQVKDDVTNRILHCIQVGTYKRYDTYGKQIGAKNLNISPSVMTVINPEANNLSKIHLFWDGEEGADYLNHLRAKKQTFLL